MSIRTKPPVARVRSDKPTVGFVASKKVIDDTYRLEIVTAVIVIAVIIGFIIIGENACNANSYCKL